jgi:hypothetical protein
VLALLLLAAVAVVGVVRRVRTHRRASRLAEQLRTEAEAKAREDRILAEMEADFLDR